MLNVFVPVFRVIGPISVWFFVHFSQFLIFLSDCTLPDRVYRSPDLAVFANITMNGANAEIANVGTIIVGVDNVLKIPAIASLHWA